MFFSSVIRTLLQVSLVLYLHPVNKRLLTSSRAVSPALPAFLSGNIAGMPAKCSLHLHEHLQY
ncbi:hypothetical protein WG66_016207 [Moniliophthora roreri]|nr:hypothetical protein WG66_016207 [Moniliophthora roreri]